MHPWWQFRYALVTTTSIIKHRKVHKNYKIDEIWSKVCKILWLCKWVLSWFCYLSFASIYIPVVSSIVIGALTSPDSLSLGNPPLTQTHFHVLWDLSFVRFGKWTKTKYFTHWLGTPVHQHTNNQRNEKNILSKKNISI